MNWNIWKTSRKNKIVKALNKLPWDISHDKIIGLLKPAIGINTIKGSKKIGVGKSKFGGLPHLPIRLEWPSLDGLPLYFFAQINLEEINLNIDSRLPKNGILLFFLSVHPSHHQPEQSEKIHQVIYFDGDISDLKSVNYPENYNEETKFDECGVTFFEHYTLPSYDSFKVEEAGLKDEDIDLLDEAKYIICELTGGNIDVGHQLLGYAASVQEDVNYKWAFQEHGTAREDLNKAEEDEVLRQNQDIILLLQIDMMDDNPQFRRIGGSGVVYFGIKESDLKACDFTKTKFAFQTT